MQLNPIADPDDCRTYKAYNYGAAIGTVVAVVVGIALLVVGFIFFYRRSRSRQVSPWFVCFLLLQADQAQHCCCIVTVHLPKGQNVLQKPVPMLDRLRTVLSMLHFLMQQLHSSTACIAESKRNWCRQGQGVLGCVCTKLTVTDSLAATLH